jgi:hypothetical protein
VIAGLVAELRRVRQALAEICGAKRLRGERLRAIVEGARRRERAED